MTHKTPAQARGPQRGDLSHEQTPDRMKAKPLSAVEAFRARQAKQGASFVTCVLDANSKAAIVTIRYAMLCTQQDAIRIAVQRYAAELSAKKGK